MQIQWNWGTKLFVASGLFALLLIGFFYLMISQSYDLVERDYYPKALEYQQRIDATMNAGLLSEDVKVEVDGDIVRFTFQPFFDPEGLDGNIVFYRPSEAAKDISIPVEPDSSNEQVYPVMNLFKGKYMVKIDYSCEGKKYYQESALFIE